MKIYGVSSGEYSDFDYVGFFSTKEKAQAFIDNQQRNKPQYSEISTEISEYEIDDLEIEGKWWKDNLKFEFKLNKSGDLCIVNDPWSDQGRELKRIKQGRVIYRNSNELKPAPEWQFYKSTMGEPTLMDFTIFSDTFERALKIANEKRLWLLANNLWGTSSNKLTA